MAFIEELPQVHFGEVKEEPIDWRAGDEPEEDEDAPASEALIELLGFDPDKEGTEDASPVIQLIQNEILDIKERIKSIQQIPVAEETPAGPPVNSGNTGGVVYNGYSIKQMLDGTFEVYSIGGALIAQTPSLELAINKISEISIKGSE